MDQFTGKERDAETGLDYFGARYFSAAQGRFTTPDWSETPEPVPYQDLSDPQTLNQYAYVRNNPLSRTDPDGHCDVDGEHHFGWCIWHKLGFYRTVKEQAADARASLSQAHGFSINGQAPAEIAKTGTDQQVIEADRAATNFLLNKAQAKLFSLCAPGVTCGVVPIGPPNGALTAAEEAEIQAIADKYNTTIDVVGSRAAGTGRNVETNLRVGKGANGRSDIDFRIDASHPQVQDLIKDLKNVGGGAGSASTKYSTTTRPTEPPFIRFQPKR